jgi:hypothetical protein
MSDPKQSGLPVHGYQPQDPLRIALVNQNKETEERLLRQMEAISGNPDFDQRWLSIARTELEMGFMALNRAIFRPGRVKLPEDPQ